MKIHFYYLFLFLMMAVKPSRSGGYREVKECPKGVQRSRCANLCMFSQSTKLYLNNRADFGILVRTNNKMMFRSRLNNSEVTWRFKHVSSLVTNILVTVFFESKFDGNLATYGTPIASCCRVPIEHGKCNLKADQSGFYYIGLSYNNETFALANPFHEVEDLAKHAVGCRLIDNITKLCLFIDQKSGAMQVKNLTVNLIATNGQIYSRDRIEQKLQDFCAYQLPKNVVLKNGMTLANKHLLNAFFNRNVYDITTYYRKEARNNCTRHELEVNEHLYFETERGHLLCFRFGNIAQTEEAKHYCMPGNETGMGEIPSPKPVNHPLEVTVILLAIGSIVLVTLFGFLLCSLSSPVRTYLQSLKTLPRNLVELQKSMDDQQSSDRFYEHEKSDEFEPFTWRKPLPTDDQSSFKFSVNDDEKTRIQPDYAEEVPSTRERRYIRCQQPEPVEGVYTAVSDSGLQIDTSSGIDSSGSSGCFSQKGRGNRVCLSEVSADTGRGSSTSYSDNEPDAPEHQFKSIKSAGLNTLDTRHQPKVSPSNDDVFFPVVPDVTCVGDFPEPGTEIKIFQTLFLKRSSADSAVGCVSQSVNIPDYSVLQH